MEEPLEGEETCHRDGEDKLAEWVHGHPSPLWEDGEKESKRKVKKLGMLCYNILKNKNPAISEYVSLHGNRWVALNFKKVQFINLKVPPKI